MSFNPLHAIDGRWMAAALDAAGDGILIESAERVVYANAWYAALLGYRGTTDIVRRPVAELVAESDAERLVRFGRMRVLGQRVPSSYDFAALRSDGAAVRLQASVSLSFCGGTSLITTIVRPFAETSPLSAEEPIAGAHDQLSTRERQVMQMLLEGKRPKVIALELGLSETTVATHRTRLLGKIGVTENRELFQYALRHRLVDWS